MKQEIIVKLEDISINFDEQKILEHINFSVKEGEIITIIGPNGSGKTTLAKIILGLIKPTSGNIWVKEHIKVGYMPQKISIDKQLPLTIERFLHLTGANTELVNKAAEEIGISYIMKKQVHDISGGEMQRVMLARSILFSPSILVLDEPIQGVDITGQIEFYELIAKIRNSKKISIIMISHDLYMVMKATDHVLCLNKHICCHGTPEDISKHPYYIEAFGSQALGTLALYSHHHDHKHEPRDDHHHA
jgi:zinc transport system ATP-binding protein